VRRPYTWPVPRHTKNKAAPAFVTPMAASSVTKLPEGPEWLYEVKWDGYRALLIKDGSRAQIRSRNDKDLTAMYPDIATAVKRIKAEQVILDGEIVALAEDGRPSFQALQHRSSRAHSQIIFYAFDALQRNGIDYTRHQLEKRRALLTELLPDEHGTLRVAMELKGRAADVVEAVRATGLEGVVAKRRQSVYTPGERSADWVKLRLDSQHEFVIGGYRPDGSDSLDALLVGFYEGSELRFAAKARAGFIPRVRREIVEKLRPLRTKKCPFANLPDAKKSRWGAGITADEMTTLQWTKPHLVAQIRFAEWTDDNRLRHAAFLGLRTDKAARDVMKEPDFKVTIDS